MVFLLQSKHTVAEEPDILNSIQEVSFFGIPMIILLGISAFFSGSETALFSLSSEDRRQLGAHRRVAGLLAILQENPSGLLTSILFGNLIVNILFFSTGAAAASRWSAQRGEWVEAAAGLIILLSVVLFGEIMPKAVGMMHPSGILSFAALPLRAWFLWTAPFQNLVHRLLDRFQLSGSEPAGSPDITPGELRELLDAVRHEPGFGRREKEVVEDIVILSDRRAREIMTPRTSTFRCSLDTDINKLLAEARRQKHRRVLVYRDREDDPLGYLRIQDLVFATESSPEIEPLLRPLVFVPETCRIDGLLRDFIEKDWSVAGVVDEYGGLAGVISMDDILAEVVGGIEEEHSAEVVQLDETTYRLNGQLPIRSWRELFIGLLPEPEVEQMAFDTLGGLMISRLGRMPRPGDSVMVCNLQLTVESLFRHRIATVLLHLQQPEGGE